MEYIEIDLGDLKSGQSGLMLFSDEGFLFGCVIERGPDGSLLKSEAARCDTGDFIKHMSGMFATLNDNVFRVIIDQGGYWPTQFPTIKRIHKSGFQSARN